jgi:hypothetical protein
MPNFVGFDSGSYPGDDAVKAWGGGGSPFQFIGFYLDAPCHTRKTYAPFAGKYKLLKSLGWGLAVVYFGRQVTGCGSRSLNLSVGQADGRDAFTKGAAEGFQPGAVLFLDVEPFDGAIPSRMRDYVTGWIGTVLGDGRFAPGIYCHAKNAIGLHDVGVGCFAAAGKPDAAPTFWVTRPRPAFNVATSAPADSGISFAALWQGQLDIPNVVHAGVKVRKIDVNVALSANPSNA